MTRMRSVFSAEEDVEGPEIGDDVGFVRSVAGCLERLIEDCRNALLRDSLRHSNEDKLGGDRRDHAGVGFAELEGRPPSCHLKDAVIACIEVKLYDPLRTVYLSR